MRHLNVSVRRGGVRDYDRGNGRSLLLMMLCLALFITVSFLMRSAYNSSREDLILSLQKGQTVIEKNNALKVEHAGITRARYLEFTAKEKLGLKKPKEEEVYVLR